MRRRGLFWGVPAGEAHDLRIEDDPAGARPAAGLMRPAGVDGFASAARSGQLAGGAQRLLRAPLENRIGGASDHTLDSRLFIEKFEGLGSGKPRVQSDPDASPGDGVAQTREQAAQQGHGTPPVGSIARPQERRQEKLVGLIVEIRNPNSGR